MPLNVHSRYWKLATVEAQGELSLERRAIEPADESRSIIHEIVGQETPDQLAKMYYNREDLWWRIADANPGRFPLDWKAGDRLVIPAPSAATKQARD